MEAQKKQLNLSEEQKIKRLKGARERYQNLIEEEKEKKVNKNFSEEKKQMLVEYGRNYYLTHEK